MIQHVPFLKTIWSQGNWSPKRLTWNNLYNDREDSFCDQPPCPIFQENSSIQNRSISIGRSYSKIAFLGLRKGNPLWTTVLFPKMEEPQFGRRTAETQATKPSISARTPLCKSYGFCSLVSKLWFLFSKRASPLAEFPFAPEILEETQFSRWIWGQGAVDMEHLATNSFLSDEAKRIWKPQT